jgi:lysophospholipid acyltransferase (LPLAT)-like uncharacterized protein
MVRSERITRLIIQLGTLIFRLWFATCRIKIVGRDIHQRYILEPASIVGATWHRNAIFLVWFFRRQHPLIMFSRSRDGNLLAGFAAKLGVIPVRGSSSRGGREALAQMRERLLAPAPAKAATVLDGPQGPPFVAKKGLIVLAMQTGRPLVPIMMSARPALTLRKAWDKTLIPLPFSRVTVAYETPWIVPPDLDEAGLEGLRRDVEKTLNRMMRAADADTGYRAPVD